MSVRTQTAGYFGGHVVLGLVSASLGPTLPALAAGLVCDPDALGLLFTARGLGYLLGALGSGRVFDRRPAHPLMGLAITSMAVCMVLVPLMPSRLSLLAIMLVIGAAQGLLDVGNNTMLVRAHGARVAPFMNALHCFYGVGAVIAPVVIEAAGDLHWAYAGLALAMVPAAAWVFAMPSPIAPQAAQRITAGPSVHRLALAAFVVLFAFNQGAEAGVGGWLYVIATEAGLREVEATRLLSGFWAAFTVGRVVSILLATRVHAKVLLGIDLLGSLISLAVLLAFGGGTTGLWLGTLGLGLALASVFPAALALAADYIQLTGEVTSRIFVGASVGTMIMPWVVGRSFAWGPHMPMVVLMVDVAVAAGVFGLIVVRLRPAPRHP